MLFYIISDFGIHSLDSTQSYDATFSNDVTQYPIESGFDVTKGVTKKSDTFTISGIISDYHLKESSDFRSDRILTELREIKDRRKLVTLVAKVNVYDNLIIASVSASESATGGHAKQVTISLQEVRTASSASTSVPRSNRPIVSDGSDPKKNDGTQSKESIERGLVNRMLTPLASPITSAFKD